LPSGLYITLDSGLASLIARLQEALDRDRELTGEATFAQRVERINSPHRMNVLLGLMLSARSSRFGLSHFTGSRNKLAQTAAVFVRAHLGAAGDRAATDALRLDDVLDVVAF